MAVTKASFQHKLAGPSATLDCSAFWCFKLCLSWCACLCVASAIAGQHGSLDGARLVCKLTVCGHLVTLHLAYLS